MIKCAYSHKRKGDDNMEELFKALSEPNRLRILSLLLEGEMCVCEIEACLTLTQSNISRHLNALKNCGILENYKKAQWVYYRISERFKTENAELWQYLVRMLKNLPTYQIDCEECKRCKGKDLCNCKNN